MSLGAPTRKEEDGGFLALPLTWLLDHRPAHHPPARVVQTAGSAACPSSSPGACPKLFIHGLLGWGEHLLPPCSADKAQSGTVTCPSAPACQGQCWTRSQVSGPLGIVLLGGHSCQAPSWSLCRRGIIRGVGEGRGVGHPRQGVRAKQHGSLRPVLPFPRGRIPGGSSHRNGRSTSLGKHRVGQRRCLGRASCWGTALPEAG